MSLKAVVFDAYDTLVDNRECWWLKSFKEICKTQHFKIPAYTLWQHWIRLEKGFRIRRLNLETLEAAQPFELYREVWAACFHRSFVELGLAGNPKDATELCIRHLGERPCFPEVPSVLGQINGQLKLAILSNADRSFLDPLLGFHQIKYHFSAVLSSEDVMVHKPHPYPFRMILDLLGVAPNEAVLVGDSQEDDILGGKLMGMKTIWVNRYKQDHNSFLPHPDFQIPDLSEIVETLEKFV